MPEATKKRRKSAPSKSKTVFPGGPVNEKWTPEEAWLADAAVNPDGHMGPAGPFFQWSGLCELRVLKEKFEQGDAHALMLALRICANHDLVMPAWVSRAYIAKFDTVNLYRAKSWDEVFGRPIPKGRHLRALRNDLDMPWKIYFRIQKILREEKSSRAPAKMDNALFSRVGKEVGINRSDAQRYYYQAKKAFDERAARNQADTGLDKIGTKPKPA